MQMAGQLAVISGASSGIGAATAQALAAAGARTILLARRKTELEAVATTIRKAGGSAIFFPVDLTQSGEVKRVATTILAEQGVPDILINNAGAGKFRAIDETTPEEMVQMMAVPYFAAFYLTRAFFPALLQKNSGMIINLISPAGHTPFPHSTAYSTARWAMRGFTESLRADLFHTRIRVMLVVPGHVPGSYFETNVASEERIPTISRLFPSITADQAATAIVRGIRCNKREVITPFLLRVGYFFYRLSPRLMRWTINATGWKRSDGVTLPAHG